MKACTTNASPSSSRDRTQAHRGPEPAGAVRRRGRRRRSGLTRPPLTLERRWQRDATGPFDRSDLAPARARGRLRRGPSRRSVEIELAPWADGVCELVIRPDVRAPHRWSGRRRRVGTHPRTPPPTRSANRCSTRTGHLPEAPRQRTTDRAPPFGRLSTRPGPSVAPRMDGPGCVTHAGSAGARQ